MTASSLRIGNWVEANTPPMIVKVISESTIELYMPGSEADNFHFDIEDLRPIPLSESILEKTGFSHHDRTVSFNDSGYDPKTYYYISDGRDEFNQLRFLYGFYIGKFRDEFYYQAGRRRNKGIRITSLHQLQNIFHALTGEELKIEL